MEKTRFSWHRLLALLMACVMTIGLMPAALAAGTESEAEESTGGEGEYAVQPLHGEGEDEEGEHDETPYAINIYREKKPNQNGSLTYTVTSHKDGTVSEPYDLDDTTVTALEGDIITCILWPTRAMFSAAWAT